MLKYLCNLWNKITEEGQDFILIMLGTGLSTIFAVLIQTQSILYGIGLVLTGMMMGFGLGRSFKRMKEEAK